MNDNVEAAIVSTGESGRYFTFLLNEKEKEQQNINEIDRAETGNIEIIDFILSNIPSEKEKGKGTDKIKNFLYKLSLKLDNQSLKQ